MSDTDEAVQAFNDHVAELEEEYDVELTDSEKRTLLGQSIVGGFSPESTLEAFGELIDDDDQEDTEPEVEPGTQRLADHVTHDVGELEAKFGRPMSDHEKRAIAGAADDQARRHDEIDVEGAHAAYQAQFATSESRSRFFAERLKEEPPEPPERELDLDKSEDRVAYMSARLNGHEFEDTEGAGE